MLPNTLYFKRLSSVNITASLEAITILLAQYSSKQFDGKYDILVEGISYNSASCVITLGLTAGDVTKAVTPNVGGIFSVTFHSVAIMSGEIINIQAANSGSGTTGTDSVGLVFATNEGIDLPDAKLAALQLEKFQFLAGTTDRVVNTKLFTQLTSDKLTSPSVFTGRKLVYGASSKPLMAFEYDQLTRKAKQALAPVMSKFKKGKLRYPELVFRAREELRKISNSLVRPVTDDERFGWVSQFEKRNSRSNSKRITVGKGRGRRHFLSTSSSTMYVELDSKSRFDRFIPVISGDDFSNLGDLIDFSDIFELDDLAGRVGLLFADRLRFQPAGLTIGEPIYTMSLAPGEEVELRQVVETKRKSTIEDIIDREQELSLNLTASWTNEITEGISEQGTVQNAIHMGVNADAKLPIEALPIGFGVNVANDASTSDSLNREQSTKSAFERTSNAASKMRSQHKIRMEVTNEVGNSLATTRRLRNANQQRSQTHIFSKVYRKERVTLERHGVQLCLRLLVNDPSFDARANFLANLDKLDPSNPAHYPDVPNAVTVSGTIDFDKTASWPDNAYSPYDGLVVSKELDLKSLKDANGTPVPSGYLLATHRTSLIEYQTQTVDYFMGIQTGESTSDPNESKSSFDSSGGSIFWSKTPALQSGSGKGTLSVRFFYSGATKTIMNIDYRERFMIKGKVKVTAEWVPSAADSDAYSAIAAQVRSDLISSCTEERILQVRELAISDYAGQALAAAVAQHLEPATDTVLLRHTFDFENSFIENAPYWSSNDGRSNYRSLEQRLLNLPIPLAVNSILTDELTAPQAIIYLPVFEGHEYEALELLSSIGMRSKSRIKEDIDAYRARNFPLLPTSLPTFDEVLGPKPPFGTPVGKNIWDSDWEKPQRRFEVMAHWQLLTPTDGVHLETKLSDSVATDEHLTRMLENQTKG